MHKRVLTLLISITLLLGFIIATNPALALPPIPRLKNYESVQDFVGGINIKDAHICRRYVQAANCSSKTVFSDFKDCVKSVLTKHPVCKQSLAFFHLTGGGVLKSIRRYHNIDVILADYVYIADQGTGYYIVTKSGEYLTLPINLSREALKAARGYNIIVKKYPRVELWQILDFPTAERLPHHRYRLIFTQQLKNGCNACALAGTAKVAYDFTNDGLKFSNVKILRLIPKR